MQKKIEKGLKETPGWKVREIAKKIGALKKEVNSFLSKHKDEFIQDKNYRWSLVKPPELEIRLAADTWVDGPSLDKSIKNAGSPLEADFKSIVFIVPEDCKILLEAIARLLALCNQLILENLYLF